jgi:hypothetical protein
LNNKEEVQAFNHDYKILLPPDRKLLILDDFSDVHGTFDKIMSLMEGDFIVVTTKEGGVGIDFKG